MTHTRPTVLVIENDLMFQSRILATLRKQGYEARIAATPEAALAALQEQAPALVLLSFGRPLLKACETTAQIRALGVVAPILGYISHTVLAPLKADAKAAGCDLLVPNSAIATRLPLLLERLAPREGGFTDIAEADRIAQEEEEEAV